MAAGTEVVKLNPPLKLDDILWLVDWREEEFYQASYPQAAKLSDKDIQTIKETLVQYKRHPKLQAIQLLADKVREVLKIENEEHLILFLKIILRDYKKLSKEKQSNCLLVAMFEWMKFSKIIKK